jgi:hypothetical protein
MYNHFVQCIKDEDTLLNVDTTDASVDVDMLDSEDSDEDQPQSVLTVTNAGSSDGTQDSLVSLRTLMDVDPAQINNEGSVADTCYMAEIPISQKRTENCEEI